MLLLHLQPCSKPNMSHYNCQVICSLVLFRLYVPCAFQTLCSSSVALNLAELMCKRSPCERPIAGSSDALPAGRFGLGNRSNSDKSSNTGGKPSNPTGQNKGPKEAPQLRRDTSSGISAAPSAAVSTAAPVAGASQDLKDLRAYEDASSPPPCESHTAPDAPCLVCDGHRMLSSLRPADAGTPCRFVPWLMCLPCVSPALCRISPIVMDSSAGFHSAFVRRRRLAAAAALLCAHSFRDVGKVYSP